jgi:predicted N-formylglutamate amidohydrolase
VRLPAPWSWHAGDSWLVGTHWSYDPGAAEITRALAEITGCAAILSRFTRLLCDPNRAEGDATCFRTVAENRPVRLNHDLREADREARLSGYHRPFHEALHGMVGAHPGRLLFSIHSFTPVYEGSVREVELGILFDEEEDLAVRLAEAMGDRGLPARLNEPYSGRDGLIYSPSRHARTHRRAALELEVRQDLATNPEWRARAVLQLAGALEDVGAL